MTHSLLVDPNSGSAIDDTQAHLPKEYAEQFEQVMLQDREFFLQHPDCDYYVRQITTVEVLEGQAMGKPITESARVLVGEVVPGSRVRLTVFDDLPLPVEEFKSLQQQMRKQMGAKPTSLKDRIKQNQKARPQAKGFG